jgi:hexosaminidase
VSSPFTLSGPDTTLTLAAVNSTNATSELHLVFTTSDGFPYPLRSVSINDGHDSGHPGRIWTNQSSSSHAPVSIAPPATLRIETDVVNGTRVWVNDTFAGRFEVFVYGGRNTLFSWSQMALVAPLDLVEGGVDGLELGDRVGARKYGNGTGKGMPVSSGTSRLGGYLVGVIFGLVVCLFV